MQSINQSKATVQAQVSDCNARINAIKQVQTNRQMVNPDFATQTQMACNQANQNVAEYNAMVQRYNLQLKEQSLAAIYSSHPSDQHRVAAVAALNDYVRGRRSLESLQQFQQSYRVMTALKQTNNALLQQEGKREIMAVSKQKSVPQDVKTTAAQQKPLADQLHQLKRGLEEGLISQEEYKAKRKEILESQTVEERLKGISIQDWLKRTPLEELGTELASLPPEICEALIRMLQEKRSTLPQS